MMADPLERQDSMEPETRAMGEPKPFSTMEADSDVDLDALLDFINSDATDTSQAITTPLAAKKKLPPKPKPPKTPAKDLVKRLESNPKSLSKEQLFEARIIRLRDSLFAKPNSHPRRKDERPGMSVKELKGIVEGLRVAKHVGDSSEATGGGEGQVKDPGSEDGDILEEGGGDGIETRSW